MRASLASVSLALVSLAVAKDGDKGSTNYAVTVNGKTYTGDRVRIKETECTGLINIRGTHNGFDLDCATLNLYDYTFTGAASADRMVTVPTKVYTSKTIELTPAQLSKAKIDELEARDGDLVVKFSTAAGKLKYQAKDKPQGGILQVETELGSGNITQTVTLADGIFFFLDPNLNNAVRFTDGKGSDSTHKVLIGKDSPQAANRLYQDGKVSQWNVWSGGRMGAVFGEDALENSPGATVCTSDCQAQNQVKGSYPVTDLPDSIVPL